VDQPDCAPPYRPFAVGRSKALRSSQRAVRFVQGASRRATPFTGAHRLSTCYTDSQSDPLQENSERRSNTTHIEGRWLIEAILQKEERQRWLAAGGRSSVAGRRSGSLPKGGRGPTMTRPMLYWAQRASKAGHLSYACKKRVCVSLAKASESPANTPGGRSLRKRGRGSSPCPPNRVSCYVWHNLRLESMEQIPAPHGIAWSQPYNKRFKQTALGRHAACVRWVKSPGSRQAACRFVQGLSFPGQALHPCSLLNRVLYGRV
jgi:hypothetical protein